MTDLEALKKELDRLQDNAADMVANKMVSKSCDYNHKRIEKIKKQIARMEKENR